jgi:uncharacterized protein (UPF0548 family)
MFFLRRPSRRTIERFLRQSQDLPLSYSPVGLVREPASRSPVTEAVAVIGRGAADFARASAALRAWAQFDIGWVETFPPGAPIAVGTVVAVLIRHLGFWSLNGCRVVYLSDSAAAVPRFGFAYGTLTNHAESGEELFEVSLDARTDAVTYRIRATSRAQSRLAWLGQPIVRLLQARFRRQSTEAMARATAKARTSETG